ncbi:CopG family transcriptional regulator [Salmonella enterica]|uniref:plasmid mobilization protein n=1 Tax=Klebsiella pneumoniae TaxID=573 RepID=UPI0011451A7E|nr:CopG family transcriptional regulator [Klebsiella pneumoniae]ECD9772027.1 CopG family transcriptional regulator [Salmonella enterica]NUC54026.1 CopG family transcriptional regulator [Escherichia coli]EIA9158990.1 CopG family transcriptional regulator [Salmonella enterica]ELK0166224.1 CopG family transcriptional regulator [Salmonella enterica]ELP7518949.1 CopG family transcriptional regulator [Salmonella enterica]
MSEVMAPKDMAARRRGKPIEVWVTDEEKAAITELADQTGLSRSAYLRAVGLNRPVGARADLEAVRELVRLNGDLGRVAGLLKLWLAEKRGQGAKPIDVERMMIDFRELQAGIREQMSAIVFTRK